MARDPERKKEYLKRNKERIKKYNAEHYIKNKERHCALNREYYKNNRDLILARLAKNKERNKIRNNAYGRARRLERRLMVLNHYSNGKNECDCCKEKEMAFLTLDHINNDGYVHRKESKNNLYDWLISRNFPDGIRVLCFNCNSGRDKSPGKVCPHELKRMKKKKKK